MPALSRTYISAKAALMGLSDGRFEAACLGLLAARAPWGLVDPADIRLLLLAAQAK